MVSFETKREVEKIFTGHQKKASGIILQKKTQGTYLGNNLTKQNTLIIQNDK